LGARKLRLAEERESHTEPNGVGLLNFVKYFWPVLEPTQPFVDGWVLQAISEHLAAISQGDITRLLINVPPGCCKSLMCNVFYPCWEWSAFGRPDHRYISFSYAAHLTYRDNRRMLSLLQSQRFKEMYPEIKLDKAGEEMISNEDTGWKFASSVGGVGTGARGSRCILDDPHSVGQAESEAVRTSTVRWFKEAMSNRLNNISTDAIIVIMQRVAEEDVSGVIIDDPEGMGYTHLRIPMELADDSPWSSSTSIGWEDPRSDPAYRAEHGNLAWPERYPENSLKVFKSQPFMWSSQYLQDPEPRGGAIIKRDWWRLWDPPGAPNECFNCGSKAARRLEGHSNAFQCVDCGSKFPGRPGKFPPCSYILASLDTAYTEQERNDPSAMTIWGVFRHPETGEGGVILMSAWRKWLAIRGKDVPRLKDESERAWRDRAEPEWGLVEWTWHTCRKFKVDLLLIENKASGISLAQELQLQHNKELWATEMVNPVGSKEARAHSVVGTFSQGLVWAPERDWSNLVIEEAARFPLGKYRDLTDSTTMALRRLRDMGMLQFEDERLAEEVETFRFKSREAPLYPV